MNNRTKNLLYSIVLLAVAFTVYQVRKRNAPEPISLSGATMGTTYHITYFDDKGRDFKAAIDSTLTVLNQSLNTYLPEAEISRFNKGRSFVFKLPHFLPVVERSMEIAQASGGSFDPTIMPLVNAWGFGPQQANPPDSMEVDSMLQFVGFEKQIRFNRDSVWKVDPRAQLDFSAIAKGYGVDVVAALLRHAGVSNMFVEIGGEVVAEGKNIKERRDWGVGILDPASTYDDQRFLAFSTLNNRALATSGNYFNYRVENGVRYSHTLDPATGYPVQREILSASVFAADCMTADAWATAFMVMGYRAAIARLQEHPEIDALIVYSGPDGGIETYVSPAIAEAISFNVND